MLLVVHVVQPRNSRDHPGHNETYDEHNDADPMKHRAVSRCLARLRGAVVVECRLTDGRRRDGLFRVSRKRRINLFEGHDFLDKQVVNQVTSRVAPFRHHSDGRRTAVLARTVELSRPSYH